MRVTRLSVTPVKGLGLLHPAYIDVTDTGVVGDRLFYIVDERDCLMSIAKTGGLVRLWAEYDPDTRTLVMRDADGVVAEGEITPGESHSADFFAFKRVAGHLVPGPWDDVLTSLAQRPARLVMAGAEGLGHDVEPLTLLSTASIARLSEEAGVADADARRFRMLIEFDGASPHEEDTWVGRQLRVGTAVIEGGDAVQRCAGTTRNPDTGDIDLQTLKMIGRYRGRQESVFGLGFNMGTYARCITPGRISVGDELLLVDPL